MTAVLIKFSTACKFELRALAVQRYSKSCQRFVRSDDNNGDGYQGIVEDDGPYLFAVHLRFCALTFSCVLVF